MTRDHHHPPTLAEIEALARDALNALPARFATHLTDVVLMVEELADEQLLAELAIDHPLDLTGVYEGVPIGERGSAVSGTMPDRIRLFRRAILDEWIEGDEDLAELVAHIVVHEVGHHFGLSDEAMHRLEQQ